MRVTDTHVYFWGSCFSNFYETDVFVRMPQMKIVDDYSYFDMNDLRRHKFPTSEHVYMAFKAIAFGDTEAFDNLLDVKHPAEAKKIGRKVKGFNQKVWDQIKYDRMYKTVWEKFSQNQTIKTLLLDTEPRTLVEGSPTDKIWGVGLRWDDDLILDEKNWKGQNLLGKVLMDVRDAFSEEYDGAGMRGWRG